MTADETRSKQVLETTAMSDNRAARRFARIFPVIALGGVLLVLTLNVLVDAHGVHMTGWLRPVVANHRLRKEFLLRQLPGPVELLVLGSSRAIGIDPAALQEVTGLEGFNAAVGSAETQDYLAWLRLFIAVNGKPPRMIVLGIDEVSFANSRPIAEAFSGSKELLAMLPEVDRGRTYLPFDEHDLGWGRTWDSLRSIYFALTGYPPESDLFDANGLGHYIAREEALENGSLDLEAGLRESLTDYRNRFAPFTALSEERIACFDRFLDLVAEHDIELVAFATPMHPEFLRRIEAETVAAQRKAEVRTLLRQRFAARGWVLHEATQPENYGGNPENYYDGVHMHPAEVTYLVESILRERQGKGK